MTWRTKLFRPTNGDIFDSVRNDSHHRRPYNVNHAVAIVIVVCMLHSSVGVALLPSSIYQRATCVCRSRPRKACPSLRLGSRMLSFFACVVGSPIKGVRCKCMPGVGRVGASSIA